MEADDKKMFLENIEEFVMDEGKIVTYKWLSATLNLHVNTAKQLLYEYAMPDNKRKDGVYMTYLVGGTLLDGSGMKIQIVRENDLDRVKSQFKLVTSEHVYSVQKASHLPDLNILYGVDNLKNENDNGERFGAIRYNKAIRRLANDITSLQIKARAATAVVNNPVTNGKKGPFTVKSSSDKVSSEPVIPEPITSSKVTESEPTKAAESKSSSSSSIASLFTAQIKTSKSTTNSKAGSVVSSNKPTAKKAKGGIAMFFTKQSETPSTNTVHKDRMQDVKSIFKEEHVEKKSHSTAEEAPIPVGKSESASAKERCNIEGDDDNEVTGDKKTHEKKKDTKGKKSQKVETNGKQSTGSSGRGNKKKSVKDSQPAKKRKRIMVISDDSDSSGDDIFGNDSDTEMQPPSPEVLPEAPPKSHSSDEDVIPSTPISQQICHGRVRKRKFVNKTFEDKDGFMMTKKEYVFESCSDDDGDNDKKANEKEVIENGTTSKPTVEVKDNVEDVGKDKPAIKLSKGGKQTRKKKASPPAAPGQKSKQSTLMSFFNKS